MQFGIFYEHQIGRPWDDTTDHRLIHDTLEQVELADSLGIQYVWEVEHHFLEEYSHSSAPEVFLAACSQRTKNIRLGHGIVLTAPQFNHPARVAERISMLDLVSNGRVEFGSGESGSEAELGGLNIPPLRKRDAWLEGLETSLRCMVETPFTGVEGEFVSMPPRNVVPKPVQKPHPPLWVACSRRETILLAARRGMGALTFAFIDPEEAEQWVADYERTLIEECSPVGYSINPQVACVTPMMLHADEDEAIRRGAEGANFFGYSLGHYYVFGTHRPGVTNVWEEYEQRRGAQGYDPAAVARAVEEERLGAKAASGDTTGFRGCTGTPEQAREFLRRYEAAGVDQVIFVLQAGRNRHEHIMESIEIFGREVLPEFVARDGAARDRKQQRLQPHVDAALARAAEARHKVTLDGYEFDALPKQFADATHDAQLNGQLQKFADDRAAGRRDPTAGILGMSDRFEIVTLAERRAIVTGGASGIGRATAIKLAELGADVVVTDIDEPGCARVAEMIGGRAAVLDVTDPHAWDRVVSTFGPFDIAFLNAGIATNAGLERAEDGLPIMSLTDEAYRRIMAINVDGVVFGARAVLPGMIERGSGDIVVTASMAGLHPIGADPVYGLTKHAVVGFVRSLAAGIQQTPGAPDVCVSAICPGFTDTNILGDGTRDVIRSLGLELLDPAYVADVVARSLDERVQAAQWVIWPGAEPSVYQWNSGIAPSEP